MEVEHPDADEEADDDADACRKVLRDVIGISNDNTGNEATSSLQNDGGPHNPVIALEEAMLSNSSAILVDNSPKESCEQRIEAELHVPNPHASLGWALLQELLKVYTSQARNSRSNEHRSDANGVVH